MLIIRVNDKRCYIVDITKNGFELREQAFSNLQKAMVTVSRGSYSTLKTLVNRMLELEIVHIKEANSLFHLIDQGFRRLEGAVSNALLQLAKLDDIDNIVN